MNTMMTWSAYSNEIQYWLHSDLSYVSLGHNNLNSDNAYFWRNEDLVTERNWVLRMALGCMKAHVCEQVAVQIVCMYMLPCTHEWP